MTENQRRHPRREPPDPPGRQPARRILRRPLPGGLPQRSTPPAPAAPDLPAGTAAADGQPWTHRSRRRPRSRSARRPAPATPGRYAGQPSGQAFGATASRPTRGRRARPPTQDRQQKNKGAGKVVGLIVAAALVGGAAGLGGAAAGNSLFPGQTQSPAAAPSAVTVNNPDDVNATTAIATKVLPSVVTIEVSSGSAGGSGSGVDPHLRRLRR